MLLSMTDRWHEAPPQFRAVETNERVVFFLHESYFEKGISHVLREVQAGRYVVPPGMSAALLTMNMQGSYFAAIPVQGNA
jgi:hypothetical protein